MIKKLAKWLTEHGILWAWDEKQGVPHIWAILLTVASVVVWHFTNWNWQYLWQGLAGVATFGLPLLAGIIAVAKRDKWNPWFWFPIATGIVIGGFIAAGLALILGWV